LKGELRIFHTGYAWTPELAKEKSKRNTTMIECKLQTEKDSETYMTYADALMIGGNLREAKEQIIKALDQKDDGAMHKERILEAYQSLLGILLKQAVKKQRFDDEEFMNCYAQAAGIDEDFPDFDMNLGFWNFEQGKWDEAIEKLLSAIKKAERGERYNSRIYPNLSVIYAYLAQAYGKTGELHKCIEYISLSLQASPYEEHVLTQLLRIFFEGEQASTADVMHYLQQIYDLNRQKDVIFLIKCALKIRHIGLVDALKPYLSPAI
jgi:tetratricopeptide (TPR) repeat protein